MKLVGEIILPGDKSISHRALMLNAISYGKATISNLLRSQDILATINVLRNLGVKIEEFEDQVIVYGRGFSSLKEPQVALDCQNSGTTARLLLGLLAGLDINATIIGDNSLTKRPMKRVTDYLLSLNGKIVLTNENYLPAKVLSSKIKASEIHLHISSAQVKSALMLAALKSQDTTIIHELSKSRNHTELMLDYLGCDIEVNDLSIKLSGKKDLICKDIIIPGDLSSAAFFIIGCLINPGSAVLLKNCGLNPTRIGLLKVLDMINAQYEILNRRTYGNEICGDIYIKYQDGLRSFTIEKDLVPLLIDEIPILALLATQIEGTSIIKDANDLRVKESDRLNAIYENLKKLGGNIYQTEDGLIIKGKTELHGNIVNTYHDHRISMMLKVAQTLCKEIKIENDCVDNISYPNFVIDLQKLLK
ncbi:MAG TPA: 3-phosphoshikimate 1-carboxyvinyltransferase [Haloplasmataceae bacterium]